MGIQLSEPLFASGLSDHGLLDAPVAITFAAADRALRWRAWTYKGLLTQSHRWDDDEVLFLRAARWAAIVVASFGALHPAAAGQPPDVDTPPAALLINALPTNDFALFRPRQFAALQAWQIGFAAKLRDTKLAPDHYLSGWPKAEPATDAQPSAESSHPTAQKSPPVEESKGTPGKPRPSKPKPT